MATVEFSVLVEINELAEIRTLHEIMNFLKTNALSLSYPIPTLYGIPRTEKLIVLGAHFKEAFISDIEPAKKKLLERNPDADCA